MSAGSSPTAYAQERIISASDLSVKTTNSHVRVSPLALGVDSRCCTGWWSHPNRCGQSRPPWFVQASAVHWCPANRPHQRFRLRPQYRRDIRRKRGTEQQFQVKPVALNVANWGAVTAGGASGRLKLSGSGATAVARPAGAEMVSVRLSISVFNQYPSHDFSVNAALVLVSNRQRDGQKCLKMADNSKI